MGSMTVTAVLPCSGQVVRPDSAQPRTKPKSASSDPVGQICRVANTLTYSTRRPRGLRACGGMMMRRSKLVPLLTLCLYLAGSTITYTDAATPWQLAPGLTNVVASTPTTGAGYPVPAGSRV